MPYDNVSSANDRIIECFYNFPICPKKAFGLCSSGFTNGTAGTGTGAIPGVIGTATTTIAVGKVTPGFNGGSNIQFCALETGTAAPVKSNVSVAPTAPSLPDQNKTEFTSSEYGKMIPIVFGQDKLGGNVFWYSGFDRDFTEDAETGDIIYYVRTSFAVGFCEGLINKIVRVWFGENVIIDETARTDGSGIIQATDGTILTTSIDVNSSDSPLGSVPGVDEPTTIKIFDGSETMLPRGIMIDQEGYDNTPAYRGLCFMLFENLIVAEGTIPTIFVEVIGDEDATMPRAVFDAAGYTNATDQTDANGYMEFLPEFDKVFALAEDATKYYGTVFSAGNMAIDNEFVLPDADGVEQKWASGGAACIVTGYGNWYYNHSETNAGRNVVVDAFTGIETWNDGGPQGGLSAHGSNGFGVLTTSKGLQKIRLKNATTGELQDYLMGFSQFNNDVGIANISEGGDMLFIGTSDTGHNFGLTQRNSMAAFDVDYNVIANNPTFATTDATNLPATIGIHTSNLGTTQAGIYLSTYALDTVTETFAITTTLLRNLSFDEMSGVGVRHTIRFAFVQPSTGYLILGFDRNGADYWFLAYNPFNDTIVWKKQYTESTLIPENTQGVRHNFTRMLDSMVFLTNGDKIIRVSLLDGEITEIEDDYVNDQNLPQAQAGGPYCYDGVSDSFFYRSTDSTQEIVRVYAGRATSNGVQVGEIVRTLLNRIGIYKDQINVTDVETLSVRGYSITSVKSLRSVFGELSSVLKFDMFESDGAVSYLARGDTAAITIDHDDLQPLNDQGWIKEHQEPEFQGARKINLSYRDVDREYTQNVQSVQLPKYSETDFDEEAAVSVSAPIVLSASEAKLLAEILLYSKIVYSSTYEVKTHLKNLRLDPGDVVTLERDDTTSVTARVRETGFGADRSVDLKLTKEDPVIYTETATLFGNTGRFTNSIIGAYDTLVKIAWLNIPFWSEDIAADQDEQHIFHAVLLPYVDDATASVPFDILDFTPEDVADRYTLAPPTTFPNWGIATTSLNNVQNVFSLDTTSSVNVTMRYTQNTAFLPTSAASYDAFLADDDINLAYVNGELVRFQTAVDNGDGTYTLSNFIRGLGGTDNYAYAGHGSGDRVIFLSGSTGTFDISSQMTFTGSTFPELVNPDSHPGGPVQRLTLRGTSNNPNQGYFKTAIWAYNLLPWPVGALDLSYNGGGDCVATWTWRDRFAQGDWDDDGDEADFDVNRDNNNYTVYWYDDPTTFNAGDATTYLRTEDVTAAVTATYTQANQTTDGFDNTTSRLYCWVVQEGADITTTPWVQGAPRNIGPIT